ncbi:NUDIX hydrolase [Candidatus Microthrix parvicella RN1]|uniref:NUDIX hydrolase n=2 Tax=Candidatus Neomicrothrix TaxID=41949 RepID=R4YZF3_9ACTN|nr:NUDIX hydrolase [Candidatus Microthrix parvicella RN1]
MSMRQADVELPDGQRLWHHAVIYPHAAAAAVVAHPDRGVLMLWRHRFITDSWGYEIPAGRVDPGEKPIDAAAREVEEETGWRPGPLTPLTRYHPSNGSSNQTFHVFQSSDATYLGDPTDPNEAERIEWLAPSRLPGLIADGQVTDGFSLTAISTAFLLGRLS